MIDQNQMDRPWDILDVNVDAAPQEIRRAYLEKIKRYPPDEHPTQFERIRDAYEAVKDPRRRAEQLLFSGSPKMPLKDLVRNKKGAFQFVGPGPWLDVLDPKAT